MPHKKVIYECKYCGKEYQDYEECETCEKSHLCDYSDASTIEMINTLKQIHERAYGYHINGMVFGMPITNFKNLLSETIKRLEVVP